MMKTERRVKLHVMIDDVAPGTRTMMLCCVTCVLPFVFLLPSFNVQMFMHMPRVCCKPTRFHRNIRLPPLPLPLQASSIKLKLKLNSNLKLSMFSLVSLVTSALWTHSVVVLLSELDA